MIEKGKKYFIVKKNHKEEILNIEEVDILKITKKNISIEKYSFKLNSNGIYEDDNFVYCLEEVTQELCREKEKVDINNMYLQIKREYHNIKPTPPTRIFNIGEKVDNGIIEKVFDNNKFYLINNGNSKSILPWIYVYKSNKFDYEFGERNKYRICFYNQSVFSLIDRHYSFNINYNPFYQRGYVWTLEDKLDLIKSIFCNIEIGKFAFIENPLEDEFDYEILDGKQRLSTIIEFYEDSFRYNGKFFSELSLRDKEHFLNQNVTVGELISNSKLMKLKYFYNLNSKGRIMEKEHLNKIEEMIKEEEE